MDNVRPTIQKTVQDLLTTLQKQLGPALQSLTLVGSAATDDFVDGKSDVNSVLVVSALDMQVLSLLAGIGPSMGRKRLRAPLLMTPAYIQRSTDVFAVEWLDFQAFHQTVHGTDPFASLSFKKEHMRLQCERQFKSLLVQLHQGFVSSAQRRDVVAALLTNIAKELLPYARAMLWLDDKDRPASCMSAFEQIQTQYSIDMEPFKTAFAFRYEKLRESPEQLRLLFGRACASIESLSQIADQWRA